MKPDAKNLKNLSMYGVEMDIFESNTSSKQLLSVLVEHLLDLLNFKLILKLFSGL